MTLRGLFVTIPILASVGCSVIEIAPPPDAVAINECKESRDCGGSGRCDDGVCVTPQGQLSALIVEVIPPTGAPSSGGVPFYLHVDDLAGKDIAVETVVHVTGRVSKSAASTTDTTPCTFVGSTPDNIVREALDGTIPVDVSFTPSERVLGISATSYSTSVPLGGFEGTNPGTASGHRFEAALPPGDYDIYIEPKAPVPGSCELLPVLLRKQYVAGDLEVTLPTPRVLPLVIRMPVDDVSLEGWKLDMLDPASGRVLSIPEIVGVGVLNADGDAREYEATLRFATALTPDADGKQVADESAHEVVRLSPPPDGDPAPVLLYERNGLGAFAQPGQPSIIDLTLSDGNAIRSMALPPLVTVHCQTARAAGGAPVEAAVTLMATSIDGLDPQPASFVRRFQVDETGLFDVQVPPGTYHVLAVPRPDLDLATAVDDWDIARTPADQNGKTIQFVDTTAIEGAADLNPSGWAYGASVRASASPIGIQQDVLKAALGESPTVPMASSDIVRGDGRFELRADVGQYDFFVQPEARSRFPWYVRPATIVGAAGRALQVTIPFPVIHRGRVLMGDNAAVVPDALLRVYAYVTPAGKYSVTPTESVVEVAETRASESGTFELLIPASLDSGR